MQHVTAQTVKTQWQHPENSACVELAKGVTDKQHPFVCQGLQREAGGWAEKEERPVKLVAFSHSGQGEHDRLSVSLIDLRKKGAHIQHLCQLQDGALQGWMIQDLTLGNWRM